MDGVVVTPQFWKGKKVFLTGHTGFKGSWLSLWLQSLGAELVGYSLSPPTNPNLFTIASVSSGMKSLEGDVRDEKHLLDVMQEFKPDVVFHMAAQSLVPLSYEDPMETYSTNVIGTASLLNGVRKVDSVRVVINVTSDKCYENREWSWGYREEDQLGGYDPYSSSKACAELVTNAFRHSFLKDIGIATVRAGNVIAGGDWGTDRLIPDIMQSIMKGERPILRNPNSTRPWQHVLDPLAGYLILAEKLWEDRERFSEAWNFGPIEEHSVSSIVDNLMTFWGSDLKWEQTGSKHPHEAGRLALDSSKARMSLEWSPQVPIKTCLESIVEWYKAYSDEQNMRTFTEGQIKQFAEELQ